MGVRNRVFEDYLALYREAARATRYRELATMQPPPFASVSYGGAGTAYALWRLGEPRRARIWIAAAGADRARDAFDRTSTPSQRRGSFLFGAAGVRWVAAMIAPTAVASFARAIAAPVDTDDYASGTAGRLLGAMLVPETSRTPALARAIHVMGDRLLAALDARRATPWTRADAVSFAHGWPGICYAALVWTARTGAQPPWLGETIARLAEAWEPGGVPEAFAASWCNGAAGALLLFAKALEVTGEPRFLAAAQRAARTALATGGQAESVCCGDAGVAFALLAFDRVDPRGGWRREARALAARAIGRATFAHPNGLFQGHPGLACLAADLLDAPRGFPAIEG